MKAQEHTIKISKTAHYYTHGKIGCQTKYLWITAHGYGQVADRFIRKFDFLDPKYHFVIAPEALSRFYWNGVRGRYAASWMTSKNRLDEIGDYCNYLDQIYHRYYDKNTDVKIVLFGFSQGSTTLYRWIYQNHPVFDYFINWAGWFPEDIQMREVNQLFSDPNHLIVIGNEDEYFTSERVKMMKENLGKENFHPEFIHYDGKHKVDVEVLKEIVKNKLI